MESHYSSTVLHCRCKQYYSSESRLLPYETVPHPTRLVSRTSKLAFPFSHTTYN